MIQEQNSWMLELGDDWDDDGAVPILVETIARAERVASELLISRGFDPDIGPCCDGSVDIFLSTETISILINIPSDGEPVDFYAKIRSMQIRSLAIYSDEQNIQRLNFWLTALV